MVLIYIKIGDINSNPEKKIFGHRSRKYAPKLLGSYEPAEEW